MKNIRRKVIIASIVILGLCIMNTTVIADPTVDSYLTNPAKPKRQATITVTSTITGEDISGVRLFIQECKRGSQCFQNQYLDMTQNSDGDWEATGTLIMDAVADYLSYWFFVTDGGEEFTIQKDVNGLPMEVDLDISEDNDTSGNDDDNGSPGFEVISLIVAIGVALILIKRKRS